jgi:predicted nucleic acid-binding protein
VRSILVDAGSLIAMLDRSDKHHRKINSFVRRFNGRLLTTWPVLTEVCHFLPPRTQINFLKWVGEGGLQVVELPEPALAFISAWMEKYLDLPMDLADASLLWIAEQTGILQILTIDLKDFAAYRLAGGKALAPVL